VKALVRCYGARIVSGGKHAAIVFPNGKKVPFASRRTVPPYLLGDVAEALGIQRKGGSVNVLGYPRMTDATVSITPVRRVDRAAGIVLGLDHQHLGRLVAVDADASALPGVDQASESSAIPQARKPLSFRFDRTSQRCEPFARSPGKRPCTEVGTVML
jgi:hypothetical protein